ncbi:MULTISPECIES: hypothetical protein [Phyllobacteriaceae]|jgi:hypothetical protein|uniref:Transporter n=2 Tax=Pseudomonadota TaxID=1224 RepID=A0A1C2DE62_9HYPH|nr:MULTISPECIES: hypothetical protein [Mesorhizobium]MBN9232919.1 transporter [Mesorhizobium sp.]MDQ0330523.1 hypothetical protein [Mesorhizobium sp. YL-MeA3-2017]OCX13007.1 transporter [Mesorhizobium hungaricum]
MLSANDIQSSLTGAWHLMLGKVDGLRLLDLSADGFWNSFFAIVVAVPAMIVGWVGTANAIATADPSLSRFILMLKLAMVDIGIWVLPLLALAAIAPRAGLSGRFVHYVVASNWASAIIAWLTLPAALVHMFLPATDQASQLISLSLFFLSQVFSWRMTTTAIGKGGAMGTAVFAGMFVTSLLVLFALTQLLNIPALGD